MTEQREELRLGCGEGAELRRRDAGHVVADVGLVQAVGELAHQMQIGAVRGDGVVFESLGAPGRDGSSEVQRRYLADRR